MFGVRLQEHTGYTDELGFDAYPIGRHDRLASDYSLVNLHFPDAVQIPTYKADKNKSLGDEQNDYNRRLARKRVRIEYLFARLKVFKTLAHRYRNQR